MKPLPPALLKPKDGRYNVEAAVRVWMHLYHGIEYDAPTAGRPYALARRAALRELQPIIKPEPPKPPRLPVGARLPRVPDAVFSVTRPTAKTARWIEASDLIRLLADNGIGFGTGEPKTAGRRGRPKTIPDAAVQFARDQKQAGMTNHDAAMAAIQEYRLPETMADSIVHYLKPSRS